MHLSGGSLAGSLVLLLLQLAAGRGEILLQLLNAPPRNALFPGQLVAQLLRLALRAAQRGLGLTAGGLRLAERRLGRLEVLLGHVRPDSLDCVAHGQGEQMPGQMRRQARTLLGEARAEALERLHPGLGAFNSFRVLSWGGDERSARVGRGYPGLAVVDLRRWTLARPHEGPRQGRQAKRARRLISVLFGEGHHEVTLSPLKAFQ